MDRCALFVDAGYVLADGAMAVHGTRRRESVSWDYPGLLQLLAGLAMERSRLPLLRCYWYDSTVEGRRSPDHDALADLPGVKLRLAKMRPGRREGVEGEIHRDLTTLARNKAVSDAMVVSGGRGSRAGHRRRPGHGHAGHPAAHRQRRQRRDPARAPPGVRRHRADQRLPAAAVRRADLRGRAAAPRRTGGRDARDPRGLQRQRARQRAQQRPWERPGAARARRRSTRPSGTRKTGRTPSGSPPRRTTRSPTTAASRTTGRSTTTGPARTTAPSPSDYGAPAPGAGPSMPDFTPAACRRAAGVHGPGRGARAPGQPAAAGIARVARPGRAVRGAGRRPAGRGRPDRRARRPGRQAGMPPGRAGTPSSCYSPVESGYNPGAVRDQFQLEAASREPRSRRMRATGTSRSRSRSRPAVPAGSAAIRRLPVHNGAQAGQPRAAVARARRRQGPLGQGPLGQPPQSPGPGRPR